MICRLAWLTDIHLNFLPPHGLNGFFSTLRQASPDALLISGDIGEANTCAFYLEMLAQHLQRPIYFVLGNHDYYRGSFDSVAATVRATCARSDYLVWLNDVEMIELTPEVGLVGHDSWADGRLGDYEHSRIMLNDYLLISDLAGLDKARRLQVLHQRGDVAAAHFQNVLPAALERYPQVLVLTHVPPFAAACRYNGQPTDADHLPHFGCQAVGDTLRAITARYPQQQVSVLCGHTHHAARAQILDNLHVWTAAAEYGRPRIEHIFTYDI